MTCEEAYTMKILIISGFSKPYDFWLDEKIAEEEPLSRITVDLIDCGADVNKIISRLHHYCLAQRIDQSAVCEKLRLYIKEQYENGTMSKADCIDALVRFTHNSEQEYESPWWKMIKLSYYYEYAEDIVSMEVFNDVFIQYLQDGTLPDQFPSVQRKTQPPKTETIIRKPPKRNFFRWLFSKK